MIGVCYTKENEPAIHLADSAYEGFSKHFDCIKITKDNALKDLKRCKFLIQVCYPNLYHWKIDSSAVFGKKPHQFRNYILDQGYLNKSIYLETGFINSQVAYDVSKYTFRHQNPEQIHLHQLSLDTLYYAVGVGGLKGQASYLNDNSLPDRLQQLNVTPLPYCPKKPSFVLLIGQAYRGISSWDIDIRKWYKDTATKIKRHTKLPIVYKPHPKTVLNERQWIQEKAFLRDNDRLFEWSRFVQIQDATAVVTYSSNASVDALLLGIPVIALSQRNVVWPIVSNCLSELAKPDGPSFPSEAILGQFLANIAYAQWTPAELRSGHVATRWQSYLQAKIADGP